MISTGVPTITLSQLVKVFEMTVLRKYDAEMLLGQISYSQKADIYNYHHGYPVHPKAHSTLDKSELPTPPPNYVPLLQEHFLVNGRLVYISIIII